MLRQLFGRAGKAEPKDVLLACLLLFTKHGKDELSLPEVLDSVSRLQASVPLGYEFAKGFLYSSRLFAHISQLEENGYLRRYEYTHDGLLPKSYITLTMLGRGRAEKSNKQLSQLTLDAISQAVETSMEQHREYWRLYPRL